MAYVWHEVLLTVSQPGEAVGRPLERGENRAILLLWGTTSASRPSSQPTGHPASQQKNHPAKKKKRHVATWIALASAGAAIVAAGVSAFQVSVASQQNAVAEQEQLVSLTASIAQQLAQQQTTVTQAAGNLTGAARTAAESNATLGLVATLTVEGQAAAVLINSLHGDGVAGIEYVEAARALYFSGDTADAITYYNDALNAPPYDATTHSLALRYLGSVYYQLGRNVIAHQDYMRATKVFGKHSLQTQNYIANTIAQAYFSDAGYQILIKGCRIAAADMATALRVMGSYTKNAINQTFQALDTKVYPLQCARAG
jgi:tetratricopeptide (TPR) repeat protein